ncbi:leucine--tRNA ligase [Candidatus Uhrbacteria bacterium]|nr:MAG: leucine--tRNA ligase [Candidatus Uhrbacteria bacterium]
MAKRPVHDIEAKWQAKWEQDGTYRAEDPAKRRAQSAEPYASKFYGLIEFPYPSGDGLHVGHPRSYTAIDVMTRKRRMEGQNVLYPIGWDAFGLPTENYAIKMKMSPQEATRKNIATFKRQIQMLGIGYDWSREINTTDPAYYKWTQWQFLKFFNSFYDEDAQKARPIEELPPGLSKDEHRLAYKAASTINWCPRCKIGLANEEAQGGVCERCGNEVEKREKAQWMIRITKYAERLLKDLDTVDYLDKIKAQQINWIGKSEGALVDFRITSNEYRRTGSDSTIPDTRYSNDVVTVFTTRPDTLFGATYLVLAPEHPLVETWINEGDVKNADEICAYRSAAAAKSEIERTAEGKEKTGTKLDGVTAVNPANGEEVPVWISDYVLATYGTGAIMAVPAHDERDFAFATKFDLPIRMVVCPHYPEPTCPVLTEAFVEEGHNVASGFLDGLPTWKAKDDMISWLEEKGFGERATTYKLRDWVFSRQRYWGEPIPIINCEKCGHVPVPEDQLPVTLPDVEAYEPNDEGESPLANMREWVEVACPSCGGKAERETDTMPNWAGSSWYFLRYCDPHNDKALADPEKLKYWMPVDLYNGGMEHTTLHLLYSRFWHKFLWDLGIVPEECGSEPYAKRRSHGLILAEGGEKMSKSKGNVVNPDDVVNEYGADVFRVYEMFMGPFDQPVPWDTNGIEGVKRFLDKVWNVFSRMLHDIPPREKQDELETLYHQTVKKVSDGIENLHFNTCVSQMMIFVNAIHEAGDGFKAEWRDGFIKLLAPFAPHLAEEIWEVTGPQIGPKRDSIHRSGWPTFDASKLKAATFELVVQVNGKVRAKIEVDSDIAEAEAKAKAVAAAEKWLEGQEPKQVIYVEGKLVSIVV